MDNERITRAKKEIERAQIDVLICRLPENVLLLSGYWPLCGLSFFVFPAGSEKSTCIVPHCEQAEAEKELWNADCIPFLFGILEAINPYNEIAEILKSVSNGKNWKRIGYEGSFENIAPAWNTAESAIPAEPTKNINL